MGSKVSTGTQILRVQAKRGTDTPQLPWLWSTRRAISSGAHPASSRAASKPPNLGSRFVLKCVDPNTLQTIFASLGPYTT